VCEYHREKSPIRINEFITFVLNLCYMKLHLISYADLLMITKVYKHIIRHACFNATYVSTPAQQ